ncbi:MAG: hypothetical protein EZS28_016354 [Streblomastix strix]|uniref:Uncharacterized protein n=1 Tax=Streblomastix strix TaxID=222440 RepID=A0A5J4VZN1_9EUKA|nr:MAG: hypothetical protein EZS28_016354 [Streblomastix strix]
MHDLLGDMSKLQCCRLVKDKRGLCPRVRLKSNQFQCSSERFQSLSLSISAERYFLGEQKNGGHPAYCCSFSYFRCGSLSLRAHGSPGEIILRIDNVSSNEGDGEQC